MASQTSSNDTFTSEVKKGLGTAIIRRALTWYDGGKYAFIPLERDIIDKLSLTRNDLFSQHVVPEGILLRRFKEI